MKKNLILGSMIVIVIVALIAVSFAAWDLFAAKDQYTFVTGDNVELKVTKDVNFTNDKKLVPDKAIKQNDKYTYELQIAKDVEISLTTSEKTTDTVEYVWDITKVELQNGSSSDLITDLASFKKYFKIVLRPASASDKTQDVAYGGKIAKSTKYNVFVSFIEASDATEITGYVSTSDSTTTKTIEEYNNLNDTEKANYKAVVKDVYGGILKIADLKLKDMKIEFTFSAENKATTPTA